MELLIDANVILDVGMKRPVLEVASSEIISRCQTDHNGWIAWHTVSNVSYMMHRHTKSGNDALVFIEKLLVWASVATTGDTALRRAVGFGLRDLEDAMQIAAAEACAADAIITRNVSDFAGSPIPVFTPEDFLAKFHPAPTLPP